jgi:hypothetical protein
MCRRGRLDALLVDKQSNDTRVTHLADILHPTVSSDTQQAGQLDAQEVANLLRRGTKLPDTHYTVLLAYLRSSGDQWRSTTDILNHSVPALPPNGRQHSQFAYDGKIFGCMDMKLHKENPEALPDGNSGIQIASPQSHRPLTGHIESIWSIPLRGTMRTFFFVRTHNPLPTEQEAKAPYVRFPRFNTHIVDSSLSLFLRVVEPSQVVTHVSAYRRQAGTYGIDRDFLVVCTSLNRGRK